MRERVARIATLFLLIAVLFSAAFGCCALIREGEEALSDDLCRTCLEISVQAREDTAGVSACLEEHGLVELTDQEGRPIADPEDRPSDGDDPGSEGTTRVFEYTDGNGTRFLCCTVTVGGERRTFAEPGKTPLGILTARKSGIALLVLFVFILFGALVIRIERRKNNRSIQNVMDMLDSFSEGRYDVRLDPSSAIRPEKIREYNEILDRLDERIFRQRSRNEALSAAMNQMQNGIVAVDAELHVRLITPVAKQLLGISGDPQGKHINDVSEDVRLDQLLSDAMRQGGVYTGEVAARNASGRGHRPLRLYISPMHKNDQIIGALAMVEDITELRRLEEMRTDFAANVSHELKTPLTSIRGFVETLLDGAIEKPELARKFLNIINLETERLTRLINDILSISRLESGMNDVPKAVIRLDKAACDVCDMLAVHAAEKQVTLHCAAHREPVWILANKDQLEQVLINLVENGIKYNKPGGSVTVQIFSRDGRADLSIADTGIGIAEEHLPRLFERFYRVDKGRSRAMGGTGLGLAIVKHLVKNLDGEIEVSSRLGEGTEFLITLPTVEGPAETDPDGTELEE